MAFIVLRVLSYFNRNRRRISVNGEQRNITTSNTGCTKIYNAKDIVEAGRTIELLKEHGIAAFSQEAGASVAMHGVSGFGMYGVDVLVETDEAKKVMLIIKVADSHLHAKIIWFSRSFDIITLWQQFIRKLLYTLLKKYFLKYSVAREGLVQ